MADYRKSQKEEKHKNGKEEVTSTTSTTNENEKRETEDDEIEQITEKVKEELVVDDRTWTRGKNELCMLFLVGLPGSGKSFVSQRLEKLGWARINQDTLGNVDACKRQVIFDLKKQKCIVLDRCNVRARDRKLFMTEARKSGKTPTFLCLFLNQPIDECKRRAKERKRHPTLQPEDADRVIDGFQSSLERPRKREGFRKVWICNNDADVKTTLETFTGFGDVTP